MVNEDALTTAIYKGSKNFQRTVCTLFLLLLLLSIQIKNVFFFFLTVVAVALFFLLSLKSDSCG